MWWIILLTPIFFIMVITLYFLIFLKWHANKIRGDKFFALPAKQRKKFENSLRKHTYLLIPFSSFISQIISIKRLRYFRYKGIACPTAIANKSVFQKAENYTASKNDIFIATQMKCGTTWMQQIVFEILHHGEGDLSDNGYRHMYALSPWIETSPNASVSMEKSPLVSRYKKRIIKTHLPAKLCPYSSAAKYIYITRDPVSCFASCHDFLQLLAGPFCPKTENLTNWFCSEDMWWGSWPDHVAGWWDKSTQVDNVLFLTFEQLKDNTPGTVERISRFLNVNLSHEELDKVVDKVSFAYMSEHEEQFEMSAPNIFSISTDKFRFMQSGSKKRDHSINDTTRQRILDFCSDKLAHRQFPFHEIYKNI